MKFSFKKILLLVLFFGTAITTVGYVVAAPSVSIYSPVNTNPYSSANWSPSVDWGSSVSCAYSYDNATFYGVDCSSGGTDIPTPPGEGTWTLYVRGDDQGNGNPEDFAYASNEFIWDTSAPSISITSPGNGSNFSSWSPDISWGDATSCMYSYDGGTFANINCASGGSDIPAPEYGSQTLYIQATDAAGNISSAYSAFTFDSGLTYYDGSYTFMGDSCWIDYTCNYGNGGSGIGYYGQYTGGGGDMGGGGEGDTTPPSISINSPTYNETVTTFSASIGWDDATTCEYEFDSGGYITANCSSAGSDIPAPTAGNHNFNIRASDSVGNQSSASVPFTYSPDTGGGGGGDGGGGGGGGDITAPNLVINSPAPNSTITSWTPSIGWDDSTVCEYNFNGNAFQTVNCASNGSDISSPGYGTYTLYVRGTDSSTNSQTTSAMFTFNDPGSGGGEGGGGDTGGGDITAPSVSISIPDNTGIFTVWPTPVVNWDDSSTCQYSYDNVTFLTVNCSLGGADIPQPSRYGAYALYIKGLDASNNLGTAQSTFTFDSPVFYDTSYINWGETCAEGYECWYGNGYGGFAYYGRLIDDRTPPNVTLNISENATVHSWSLSIGWDDSVDCQYTFDEGSYTTVDCASAGSDIPQPLPGQRTLYLSGKDSNNNVQSVIRHFTYAPVYFVTNISNQSITSWSAPTVSFGSYNTSCKYSYGSNSLDNDIDCSLNGSDIPAPPSEGSQTLYIQGTNTDNISAQSSVQFTYDITAPVVSISAPAGSSLISTWAPSIDWGSGATVCSYSYNAVTYTTVVCSNNGSDIPPPTQGSNKTLYLQSTDAAGNSGSASVTFSYDSIAPTISSVTSSAADTSATITWSTNEAASTQVLYGASTAFGATTTETDTSPRVTNHSVSLTGLRACSTYFYTAQSKDAFANTGTTTTRSFTTTGCLNNADVATSTAATVATFATSTVSFVDTDNTGVSIITQPAFTSSSSVTFQILKVDSQAVIQQVAAPTGLSLVGVQTYDLKAFTTATSSISTFSKPLLITMAYSSADVVGLDVLSLKIYTSTGGDWTPLSNCIVNTGLMTVTCEASHFSLFSLFGSPALQTTPDNTSPSPSTSGAASLTSSSGRRPLSVVVHSTSTASVGTSTGELATSTIQMLEEFRRTLTLASRGADVLQLQRFLNLKGFFVALTGAGSFGQETFYFGPKTYTALIKYQIANNLPGVGILGPLTRALINAELGQ